MRQGIRMFFAACAITAASYAAGFAADLESSVPPRTPVVPWTRFSIQYTVRDIGGSGPKSVEFYITADMGKSWKLYGQDPDARSPMMISVPGDGVYGFMTVGTDNAGNRERAPVAGTRPETIIIVDRTLPSAKWASPSKNQMLGDAGVMLSWEAKDKHMAPAPVSIEYSTDNGGSWLPLKDRLPAKGNFRFQPPNGIGGSVSFRLNVRDRAGNRLTMLNPHKILLDKTPPVTEIMGPDKSKALQVDLKYAVSDNKGGTGIESVTLWYSTDDGDSWELYGEDNDLKSPMLFSSPVSGKVGLILTARDKAGNEISVPKTGTKPEFYLTFDTEAPLIQIDRSFTGINNTIRGGKPQTVRWSATDANIKEYSATLSFSSDGGSTWQEIATDLPVNGPYEWVAPKGVQSSDSYLRVTVLDTLGNVGTSKSHRFTIDPKPPVTYIDRVEGIPEEDATTTEAPKTPASPRRRNGGEEIVATADQGARYASRTHPEGYAAGALPAAPRVVAVTEKKEPIATKPIVTKPVVTTPAKPEDKAIAKVSKVEAKVENGKVTVTPKPRPEKPAVVKTTPKPVRVTPTPRPVEAAKPTPVTRKDILSTGAASTSGVTTSDREREKRIEQAISKAKASIEEEKTLKATAIIPESDITKARELLKNGETSAAIEVCRQLINANPRSAEAYGVLGRAHFTKGDISDAISYTNNAVKLDKNEPTYWLTLGEAYYQQAKNFEKSRRTLTRNRASTREIERVIENREEAIEKAENSFLQVKRLAPNQKEGYDRLGDVSYFRAKQAPEPDRYDNYREAIQYYKKGYSLGEASYKEAFQLGVCYYRLKELVEAQRYLERSIEVQAELPPKEAFWYLAEIQEKVGDKESALRYWIRAADAYPKNSRYYKEAKGRADRLRTELGTAQ